MYFVPKVTNEVQVTGKVDVAIVDTPPDVFYLYFIHYIQIHTVSILTWR